MRQIIHCFNTSGVVDYDGLGRKICDNQTTPQLIYDTRYNYDSAGRLTFVYDGNPMDYTTSYLAALGYDTNGNRSNLSYYIGGDGLGDTVGIDYDYDIQNRLTGYTATGVTFSFDADGAGDVDGLGRLASATETVGANTYSIDYDYNDRSELTGWQINTTTGSYGYDLAGNITSDGTDTYSYTGDLLTSIGSNSLNWDYIGALTSNLSSSIVRNPDGQIQSAVVGSDSVACKIFACDILILSFIFAFFNTVLYDTHISSILGSITIKAMFCIGQLFLIRYLIRKRKEHISYTKKREIVIHNLLTRKMIMFR